MALAYYMNKHIPRPITIGFRLLDVDVLTTQEDQRTGTADEDLFDCASELARVMVSFDADMVRHAARRQREGIAFPSLVFCHLTQQSVGDCIRDLEVTAKTSESEDLANAIIFLPL